MSPEQSVVILDNSQRSLRILAILSSTPHVPLTALAQRKQAMNDKKEMNAFCALQTIHWMANTATLAKPNVSIGCTENERLAHHS